MADSKITALTALTGANVATGDQLTLVDVSDTTMDATGTNKKIGADELAIAMATTLGVVGRDKIWDTKGDLAVATGADAASKLVAGANGTILQADSTQTTGLKWATGRCYVVDEVHADAGSASSTAEQTLASFTLPAGVVAAGDVLRCFFYGDRINNQGANNTYTWKFKIGATTVINTGAITVASGANRTPWSIEVDVTFGATNAERANFQLLGSSSGTAAPQTAVAQSGQIYGTAAEDSASALTVALTCQLGANSSLLDVILHAGSMWLVKK